MDHDYIVVKTLKVPLILERGNNKLIELLGDIIKMPHQNREQGPIFILIDHLYKRDIKYMWFLFSVYVVLAFATFIYLMSSAAYFDKKQWYGYPFIIILDICTIIILAQRAFEIYSAASILKWRRISGVKKILLTIDIGLGVCTLIFTVYVSTQEITKVNRLYMIYGTGADQITLVTMIFMIFGASWKILEGLRMFEATRTMSQFFIFVIWDLKWFVLILLGFTGAFSMLEFMNRKETSRERNRFGDIVDNFFD